MAKPLSRSAVRIYGALSALGDGSADVLTRLLPFFEPVLREKNGTLFDPEEFAASVRTAYKWNFNTDIVEVFVPRLEETGWLTASTPERNTQSFVVSIPEQLPETEAEKTASQHLREIAERFQHFAQELSPLTAIPLEVEEYEDMLIEWLIYVEAFSEDSIDFKQSVQTDSSGTMRNVVEVPNNTSLDDEQKFLCARFVRHEIEQGGSAAEILARIASIGLLTEVVQDFVRPSDAIDNTDLIVYLDAPIALEMLGVSGRSARDNTIPIIEELQRIGAKTRIFSQSLSEMSTALKAVLQNPRPTGPTAQALARGEVLRDFVAQVAANPTPFLEEHDVAVVHRTLEQTPSEHQYFTTEQRQEVFAAQIFQQNFTARDHDADITSFVMRQRGGKSDKDIFRSGFVVMTRNGLLAQVVRRVCLEMELLSRTEIPPVVHRRVLTAAMWLRTGLGTSELEVPKRMLLANCEQVLAVRKGVVEAVKRLTDALDDEEKVRQLDLLIQQDRSTQMLMDKTLGAASVVTEQNLPVLFAEMLHPHLEEEREKGQQAVLKEKRRGSDRAKKLKGELEFAQNEAKLAEEQLRIGLEEDQSAVVALGSDVSKRLAFSRMRRRIAAGVLALASCGPLMLSQTPFSIGLAILVTFSLAYLTLTGSGLIGVTTGREKALAVLRREARRRMMEAKVDRFSIDWTGDRFDLKHAENAFAQDLLTSIEDDVRD